MKGLSVVGLGKLGACFAACFAYKGIPTLGLDINVDFVDAINSGKSPVVEPGLQDLIDSCESRLKATQDYEQVLTESEITFLVVPTPSSQSGHFSDKYLQDSLKHLSEALKKAGKEYHLFVITSTVSPGSSEDNLIPLIESVSGKKLNRDFGVCYSPEFIALGSVISDFLNPDLILIGESDQRAGDRLEAVYKACCENAPYMARMSLISAEIMKISLNSYVTMKISFANTLANICEAVPGANIDDITKALGADKRISPHYLQGALGYGGPCFPRDNNAFLAFAAKYGVDAMLAKSTDSVNEFQTNHLLHQVGEHISNSNNNVVSILGLAYKPNTPEIEESAAKKLIEELIKRDLEVIVYDPLAMDNTRNHFGEDILYASSVRNCLSNSSLCIITTPDKEFKSIDDSYIIQNPTIIIDCWRILEPSRFSERVRYFGIGIPSGGKS